MTISTDAYLMWGAPLRVTEYPWNTRYSWEDYYAMGTGLCMPEDDADDDTLTAYFHAKDILVKKTGVELERHCHANDLMWFIGITTTKFWAWRGEPTFVGKTLSEIRLGSDDDESAGWAQQINAFCTVLGAAYTGELGWWLFSYAG
jgi:hypothetical protein